MEDDFDQALKLDVLAASLRADHKESSDMLEELAKMLNVAVPEHTTVTRGGWFMSSNRPIVDLTVRFDEYNYQIVKEKHGSFSARAQKIVRGVVLKTTEIPIDKCIDDILAELSKLAESNAAARRALNKIVLG